MADHIVNGVTVRDARVSIERAGGALRVHQVTRWTHRQQLLGKGQVSWEDGRMSMTGLTRRRFCAAAAATVAAGHAGLLGFADRRQL